jgi:hypothetical protein
MPYPFDARVPGTLTGRGKTGFAPHATAAGGVPTQKVPPTGQVADVQAWVWVAKTRSPSQRQGHLRRLGSWVSAVH